MTITVYPVNAVSSSPTYEAKQARQALGVLSGVAPAGRPLGAVSGVRAGTPTTTVSVSGSAVTVGPHAGILDLETSAAAGAYLYASDANDTSLSTTTPNATNPRIDLISVQVDDPSEDVSTVPLVKFVYTAGTAAPSPSAPATPARNMALAHIRVEHSGGGASTVTWVAPTISFADPRFSAQEGGTSTALTGGTPLPITAYTGSVGAVGDIAYSGGVFTVGTAGRYRWSGSALFNAGTAGHVLLVSALVNGSAVQPGRQSGTLGAHQVTLTGGSPLTLDAGDTVQMVVESYDEDAVCFPEAFSLERIY